MKKNFQKLVIRKRFENSCYSCCYRTYFGYVGKECDRYCHKIILRADNSPNKYFVTIYITFFTDIAIISAVVARVARIFKA
jgi:hypothetical protein